MASFQIIPYGYQNIRSQLHGMLCLFTASNPISTIAINTELLQNAMLCLHLFIDVSMKLMIKNYVLQSQKQMYFLKEKMDLSFETLLPNDVESLGLFFNSKSEWQMLVWTGATLVMLVFKYFISCCLPMLQ